MGREGNQMVNQLIVERSICDAVEGIEIQE
jgi:hypothetical protein